MGMSKNQTLGLASVMRVQIYTNSNKGLFLKAFFKEK